MKHLSHWIFFIPIVLLSCSSSKPNDFVGVYEFSTLSNYVVIDTSIVISGLLGPEPLMITKRKLTPLKIDIFKNGEQLSGQMTITVSQKYDRQKGLLNTSNDDKMPLSNLHIVNDTLVFDLPKGVALKGLKTNSRSFKLVPSDGGRLVIYSDEVNNEELACCNLIEVRGKRIVLLSIQGHNLEKLTTQANDCLSQISFQKIMGKYNTAQEEHLKELLYQ